VRRNEAPRDRSTPYDVGTRPPGQPGGRVPFPLPAPRPTGPQTTY